MEARGGHCIAIQCDHTDDEDIRRVFEQIEKEQNGRLDLLVNNAFAAINVRSSLLLIQYQLLFYMQICY